jgi:putative flippase GtrA
LTEQSYLARKQMMKAIREISHQDLRWIRIQRRKRMFDAGARDELLARLFKEKSAGRTSGEMLGQFARFCVVGTSNAIIDFGALNVALAAFPTRATVPLLAYNSAAVVLAATNSFVWNRRFTFRVRGPLQTSEIVRFVVVAAGTTGLNDLVLLALSGLFPALMTSGALGANVLKLGAILGAMALSFFGMRCWVFLGKRLSSSPSAKAEDLSSASQDNSSRVQDSLSVAPLKQHMEV